MLYPSFSSFSHEVQPGITIYGIKAGSGPALLLLHGFPQTHLIWHLVAEQLTPHYTVVIPDLRGYGQSSKPPGSASHQEYAKSAMAADMALLMTSLGHSEYFVCGHDRGARVAHKLCVDHPRAVRKAMLLDICPTLTVFERTDQLMATMYFHWFFLIQPSPFPETLMVGNPDLFAKKFLGGWGSGLDIYNPECVEAYTKMIGQKDAAHSMCEDYRAAATVDLQEAKDDIAAGRKIKCPVRVLWGKKGLIERCYDAVKEWQDITEAKVDGEALESGHFIPEEVPDALLKHIREFFV